MSNKTEDIVQQTRDWISHFSGTIVSFDDEGVIRPLQIEQLRRSDGKSFENSRKDLSIHEILFSGHVCSDNGNITQCSIAAADCILGFPELGFFDGNYTAGYSGYLSRRQFRKALTDSVYYVRVPYLNDIRPIMNFMHRRRAVTPRNLSLQNCLQIFNSRYTKLEDSYEKIMSSEVFGLGLSRKFGLFATDKSEHPVIVYRSTPIGFVDEHGTKIHTLYSELVNEFTEKVCEEVELYE